MHWHSSSQKPSLRTFVHHIGDGKTSPIDAGVLRDVLSGTPRRSHHCTFLSRNGQPLRGAAAVTQTGWVVHPSALSSLPTSLSQSCTGYQPVRQTSPHCLALASQLLDRCEFSLTASPRLIVEPHFYLGHTPPLPSFNHLVDLQAAHMCAARSRHRLLLRHRQWFPL